MAGRRGAVVENNFYNKLNRFSIQVGKRDKILAAHVERISEAHDTVTVIQSNYQQIHRLSEADATPSMDELRKRLYVQIIPSFNTSVTNFWRKVKAGQTLSKTQWANLGQYCDTQKAQQNCQNCSIFLRLPGTYTEVKVIVESLWWWRPNCGKQGLKAEVHFYQKSKGRRGKGKKHTHRFKDRDTVSMFQQEWDGITMARVWVTFEQRLGWSKTHRGRKSFVNSSTWIVWNEEWFQKPKKRISTHPGPKFISKSVVKKTSWISYMILLIAYYMCRLPSGFIQKWSRLRRKIQLEKYARSAHILACGGLRCKPPRTWQEASSRNLFDFNWTLSREVLLSFAQIELALSTLTKTCRDIQTRRWHCFRRLAVVDW